MTTSSESSVLVAPQRHMSPVGAVVTEVGALAHENQWTFSTKYTDQETGLLYYGKRYYQPQTGRWLSRDSIEERGGLNLYGFARNAPQQYFDIHGSIAVTMGSVRQSASLSPRSSGPSIPGPTPQPGPGQPPSPNPPPSRQCRIDICCKPVGVVLRRAHCVVTFTDDQGTVTGCRAGPSGDGPSGGANKGKKPAHCKGCCGDWGSIVTECGTGTPGSRLGDDLDHAAKHPGNCTRVMQSVVACSYKSCIEREMGAIGMKCYIYDPDSYPNSNTALSSAISKCFSDTHGGLVPPVPVPNPPGWQPGWGKPIDQYKTCAK